MSIRVDDSPLIASSVVVGDPGHGVLASSVPSTGEHGPGYIYDQITALSLTTEEVRGLITTPPASGELVAFEDSSFEFTAPDGTYSFQYQLYVDGVSTGTVQTVNITIGAGTTISALSVDIVETLTDTVAVTLASEIDAAVTIAEDFSPDAFESVANTHVSVRLISNEQLQDQFSGTLDTLPVQAGVAIQIQEPEFDDAEIDVFALNEIIVDAVDSQQDALIFALSNANAFDLEVAEVGGDGVSISAASRIAVELQIVEVLDTFSATLSSAAFVQSLVRSRVTGTAPYSRITANAPKSIADGFYDPVSRVTGVVPTTRVAGGVES